MITKRKFNPAWLALIALVLASLACVGGEDSVAVSDQPAIATPADQSQPEPQPSGGNGLSSQQRADLIAGTVRLLAMFPDGDEYSPLYSGSGTIISPDGYILTNAHVAKTSVTVYGGEDPAFLLVGLNQAEDKPPVFSYIAEVVAVDGYLDLALLRIVATSDGNKVNQGNLNLPYVDLGDSDQVHLGDHVNLFSFPSTDDATITYTEGIVAGFASEDQVGDHAYIKIDATQLGGISGGLAANDDTQIIGVPTSVRASGSMPDCRPVQDTNGDNLIDENDACVPPGNFITDVRPINLAKPLILAARNGQEYASPYQVGSSVEGGGGNEPSSGDEQFGPIVWVTVDKKGNIDEQVDSYPSGTDLLVGVFEYSGMTDGQTWGVIWYQDGQEYTKGAFEWDGGSDGAAMPISLGNEDNSSLSDGTYSVDVFIVDADGNGTVLTNGEVTVGGGGGGIAPRPGKDNGVQISGQIVDNDSQHGIKGARVIVLNPGVTVKQADDKNYPDSMIFTLVQADLEGNFKLPKLLQRDTAYTFVVGAKGYARQVFVDVSFTADDSSYQEFTIPLTKR